MKRADVLKNIVISLALVGFVGCSSGSNTDEKNKLKQQITDAQTSNDKSVALIKVYEEKLAKLQKEEDEMLIEAQSLEEQKTIWADSRSDRMLQIKALDVQIEKLSEELRALSANRNKLEELVAQEKLNLKAKKIELQKAKDDVAAEITKQEKVVAQAEAKKNKLINDGNNKASEIIAAAEEVAEKARLEKDRLEGVKVNLERKAADLAAENVRLEEFQDSLDAQKTAVESAERILKAERNKFSTQVSAARKIFLEKGKEKIFDGLVAGQKYPFMISVVGTGDYSVLQKVRTDIQKSVKDNKYAKHKKINPITNTAEVKLSEKDHEIIKDNRGRYRGPKKQVKLQDGRWFVENIQSTDSVNVRDAFLMDATIEQIAALEMGINEKIENKYSQESGVSGANFWVSIRPVQDVEVSAEVAVFGQKGYGANNEIKLMKKVSVDPQMMDLSKIDNIDLTNLSEKIFGTDSNGCSVVDTKCLVFLKERGVLAAKDDDGKTLESSLVAAIDQSVEKIYLEQKLTHGSARDNVSGTWEKGLLWGRSFVPDEAEQEAAEKAFERMEELEDAATIQYIRLSLKVKSIYNIEEGRTTTDVAELMKLGSIEDTAINKKVVSKRGLIEIELPVTGSNVALSKLPLLNSETYKVKAVKPIMPIKPKRKINGKDNVEYNSQSVAYDKEMNAYVKAMKLYDKTVKGELNQEYLNRLESLKLELNFMKRTIED